MYRRKVLTDNISNRLRELVDAIAQEKGFSIIKCDVFDCDHVRCMVSAPPKLSITQIAKYIKGISGNTLLKEYPEIKPLLWHNQLWNGSFFCETVGSTSEGEIMRYIEKQKDHQR